MDTDGEFAIELVQLADYRFAVHFSDPAVPELVTDEGAPLGGSAGPSPSQLLGTAVANCLAASLLFAMRKFGNEPGPLRAAVTVSMERNPRGRLRIGGIGVDLHIGIDGGAIRMADRILAQFEDFCVVTQSVRSAIVVAVRVLDRGGTVLHSS